MKLDALIRRLLLSLLAAGGLLLSSCVEEAVQPEEGFSLYYPAITEIAPSTNINVTPTWRGGSPRGFSIASITCDGVGVETECFAVDRESGVFSITASDNLPVGMYRIDITCVANGIRYTFEGALNVEMMKPVPDGIVVEPNAISAKLNDVLAPTKDTQLPTAVVTSDGSNHVQIKEILISNVYLDGELFNDAKEWFEINSDGVFSIIPENQAFEAGIYTFDLKVTTYIAGKDSEQGIFKNALTLNVTSAPTRVQYAPESLKVEFNVAGQSSAPLYKGSREGLKYEIKSVSPSNIGITIDPATGVLNFPKTDKVSIGDEFTVSLKVTNDFGTADFDEVFKFTVIAFLDPITTFSYGDISENISGVSFNNPVTAMDGAEVTYEFVNLPEALSKVTLDRVTGVVSNPKGSELPVGDYTITVRATNAKGSKDASFALKVVKNPNYFTYVRWGNNLGENGEPLLPLEKYGNQFRIFSSKGQQKFRPVESDIPEGAKVTYKADKPSTAMGGISIGSDGLVTINARTGTQFTTQPVNIAVVTVGEGEAAISRRFPIFADCYNEALGSISAPKAGTPLVHIMYTPFVIRVNPKTGGLSDVVPTVTDADGNDIKANCALDFNTNGAYYYIDGPAHHNNAAQVKNDTKQETFLANVWNKYFKATNQKWNGYSQDVMGYWGNKDNGRLDFCGGYVDDANDWRIRINPEKFVDADGNYANGVMYMTMAFTDSRKDPKTANPKHQCNRVLIWLDPTYTE